MQGYDISVETGTPFQGRRRKELEQFLKEQGLSYEEGIDYSCILRRGAVCIGAGSLEGNVLKCIAVEPACRGEGILSKILSQLLTEAHGRGEKHLFLYTKPGNEEMFAEYGFYSIVRTDRVLLMEDRNQGIAGYVRILREESRERLGKDWEQSEKSGAVVMNCNPFTKGHRYLIEQALKECTILHIFVVSSDRSFFPAQLRYDMVREGTKDLPGVVLHRTEDYLVSPVTFPAYFLKESDSRAEVSSALDVEIFRRHIVPALHIRERFVGTEPYCAVTRAYNEEMKKQLPRIGVEVREILRLTVGTEAVSASGVREYVRRKQWADIKELVPETTWKLLAEADVCG